MPKPIHMANKSVTGTICGLSLGRSTAFLWLVNKEEYKAEITCKRCQHGIKNNWKQD